jgi:hypothetical protein
MKEDLEKTPKAFAFTPEIQTKILTCLLVKPEILEASRKALIPDIFDREEDKVLIRIMNRYKNKYRREITDADLAQEIQDHVSQDPKANADMYSMRLGEIVNCILEEADFDYLRDKALAFAQFMALKTAIIDAVPILKSGQGFEKIREKVNAAYLIGTDGELDVENAEGVETKVVEWLWHHRIPKAKYSLLTGNPDVGKSYLSTWLAAVVTTGGRFPDCSIPAEQGHVVVLSAEDEGADTWYPRFDAHGGDRRFLCMVKGTKEKDGRYHLFSLIHDLQKLEELIAKLGNVRLIIIDPISSYLGVGKEVNAHVEANVRGILAPVSALAARANVAVLGVAHVNKEKVTQAIFKIQGSIAWVAAARAVWLVDKEPDPSERRFFQRIKCNLAPPVEGLAFTIPRGQDDCLPAIEWLKDVEVPSADDLVTPSEMKPRGRPSKHKEAMAWVVDMLKDGPMPNEELEARAKAEGVGRNTFIEAKKALGVKLVRAEGESTWKGALCTLPPSPDSEPVQPLS